MCARHYCLHVINIQLDVTTAAVIQDFHEEIKARAPPDGPEPHSFTLRDLCVHVHVVFICVGTVRARTCVFMSELWTRPFLTSAMPAVPTIRRVVRLPGRPLNPPPRTLTASPWEADPEGLEAPPPLKPCTHVLCTHICTAAVKRPCSHEELAAVHISTPTDTNSVKPFRVAATALPPHPPP